MSARAVRRAHPKACGPDEAVRRMVASSACFSVGDRVDVFDKFGGYAGKATVHYDYGLFEVISDDGIYVDSDGEFIEYRYGYIVQLDSSGELLFVPAHALTDAECRPTYLQMVAANGRLVGDGSPQERGRRC